VRTLADDRLHQGGCISPAIAPATIRRPGRGGFAYARMSACSSSRSALLMANRRSEPISARRPVAQSKRGNGRSGYELERVHAVNGKQGFQPDGRRVRRVYGGPSCASGEERGWRRLRGRDLHSCRRLYAEPARSSRLPSPRAAALDASSSSATAAALAARCSGQRDPSDAGAHFARARIGVSFSAEQAACGRGGEQSFFALISGMRVTTRCATSARSSKRAVLATPC
jgi:hypothetical protein